MMNELDNNKEWIHRRMDGWLNRWMNDKHIDSSKWLTRHTQTHECLCALSPGVLNTMRGRHAICTGLCTALVVVHRPLTSDPEVAVLIALATIPCEVVPLQKVTTESETQADIFAFERH